MSLFNREKLLSRIFAISVALAPLAAVGQQYQTIPDHSVIGRIGTGSGSGPSQAIPFSSLFPNIVGPQSPNKFFAGPTSDPVTFPGWRAIVTSDLPAAAQLTRATIKVQRTNTSGSATWGAYDAFNNYLTACNTSATACAQAAINTAFPYAAGTAALGYDLEFIGGNDPAPNGAKNGGGATVLNLNAALSFPAIQGSKIRSGTITYNNISTTQDILTFDSCEMCDVDFSGAQMVLTGTNPTGMAIRLKPVHGTPFDGNFSVSPANFKFQSTLGRVRFDLSGGGSGYAIEYINFHLVELNAGVITSGCALLIDSPISGQNMGHNHIEIEQLHGIGSGGTALCEGTTTPAGGAVFGKNTYNIGMAPDATNSANGVDTWGSGNEWHIQATGFNTGFTLKFESGSCNNIAFISSDQASPTITDSSGCTGTSANIWFVNGAMFVAGVPVSPFQMLTYAVGGAFPQATTLFLGPAGAQSTEILGQAVCPLTGTFRNLRVLTGTIGGTAQTLTATVRVNGVSTSLTAQISTGSTSGSDSTHTATCTAGQPFDIQLTSSATTGSIPFVTAGVTFDSP